MKEEVEIERKIKEYSEYEKELKEVENEVEKLISNPKDRKNLKIN